MIKNRTLSIAEITSELETFAPLSLQEKYDNSGLLIGNKSTQIKKALLSLDCTEAVVDEAIKQGAGLIIAHHPIIFDGLKSLTGKNYIEKVVVKAIQQNIAIYACHTNLDNVKNGVNHKIAEKLGLQNLHILQPSSEKLFHIYVYTPTSHVFKVRNALFEAGAGEIGNYNNCSFSSNGIGTFKPNENASPFIGKNNQLEEVQEQKIEVIVSQDKVNAVLSAMQKAHPYEEIAFGSLPLANHHPDIGSGMIGKLKKPLNETEFLKLLKKQFKTQSIRHTSLLGKSIENVAICGGSGSFLLQNAIRLGADAFVTSDFKYHQFFDTEGKILLADIGHYESEQFTPEIFYAILSKKFPNFAFHLSSVNTNPIHYY